MTITMANLDDADLVVRAIAGDQSAVGAIYDRYSDAIYSFCRSRLRHDADAADCTQDTFVRAATRLSQLREPAKLRSWLYAIARNQVVATSRASSRLASDDAMDLLVAPDSEPDIDLLRVESANQLWDAADGLTPRDQEVLELHLRHGLVGQSLADAIGVSESHANVLLSRLRDRVGTSLGGLLVARSGRQECRELDLLLAAWDGRFTIDVRSKVNRHLRVCDVCEQTRTRVLAGGVSFGLLPIIPAPSFLRERTVGQMSHTLGIDPTSAAGPGSRMPSGLDGQNVIRFFDDRLVPRRTDGGGEWDWLADGFPDTATDRARRGVVLFSAAAAFVLLVVLGGVSAMVFRDSPTVETASDVEVEVAGAVEVAAPPTAEPESSSSSEKVVVLDEPSLITESTSLTITNTSSTTATEAATTTTKASAPSTELQATETKPPTTTTVRATTTKPSTTTVTTTRPVTTTDPPTTTVQVTTTETPTTTEQATTTETPTTTEPTNRPPVFGRVTATPRSVEVDRGSCQGDAATVLARVTDPDGTVVSVVATWSSGLGEPSTSTLLPTIGAAPDTWAGSIGAWVSTGPQSAEIIATDDDGATQSSVISVMVLDCPAG